jgi:hypothetical protein
LLYDELSELTNFREIHIDTSDLLQPLSTLHGPAKKKTPPPRLRWATHRANGDLRLSTAGPRLEDASLAHPSGGVISAIQRDFPIV